MGGEALTVPFSDIETIAAWLAETDIDALELRSPTNQVLSLQRQGGQGFAAALVETKAPAVGCFLHSHPLQATPLAAIGQSVVAGQLVGLLQIGVILLPIPAVCAGRVAEMTTPHGALVGYGDALVKIWASREAEPWK